MPRWSGDSEQAVRVVGGGKSLSVLAAPEDERTDDSYQLSVEGRKTLASVLAEDIKTPEHDDA